MGGRIGAEPQSVRRRGPLQIRVHHTGLHGGRSQLGVDADDLLQIAQVKNDALPTALPSDGGASTAHRQRNAQLRRDLMGCVHLVDVLRTSDRLGQHAVEARVRCVHAAGQGRIVRAGNPCPVQVVEELGRSVRACGRDGRCTHQ